MLRSLPRRDAARVAAVLEGLKDRVPSREASGDNDARTFLETRAGDYRVLYRVDRRTVKVALLNHIRHARVREGLSFDDLD